MAILLAEHANEPVDVARVVKMVLIHDIVEIDAGDTYFYDTAGALDKAEREHAAADRLFGILPADQGQELRELWEEFDAGETADARFALALDRFMPQLHNYHTHGRSWAEHGITAERVLEGNASMADRFCRQLWECARSLLDDAVAKGFLSSRQRKMTIRHGPVLYFSGNCNSDSALLFYGLRSLLSLSGELILLFDPFPAQPTKFLTKLN